MTSFRSTNERRVARRLWTTDLGWQYQVRIELEGGSWMRVDFFHSDRKEIIEVQSSGEMAKWSITRLNYLRKMGYKLYIISEPDEVTF